MWKIQQVQQIWTNSFSICENLTNWIGKSSSSFVLKSSDEGNRKIEYVTMDADYLKACLLHQSK